MTFGQLPIVLQQEVTQCDLDLIGSKEPARACVLSVAKAEVLLTGADKVRHLVLSRSFPHAQKPVSIKLIGVLVVL